MPNFKQMPMTPTQVLMFPVSVDEAVPRNCDVRILGEVMDLLDWSEFEAGYSETGCPAYPPQVLAKVLVYGYSKGMRSSRISSTDEECRVMKTTDGLRPAYNVQLTVDSANQVIVAADVALSCASSCVLSWFGKTAEAIGRPKTRSRILVAVKVWG